MKPDKFVVCGRPELASLASHPTVGFRDYEQQLAALQGKLQLIQQAYLGTREHAVAILEGWDTAGKGGVVRRLGWTLDPRSFRVYPIAAPTQSQRAQHYLQRFWRGLPEYGQIVVFDRSWYGRVLVERVEGFASKAEWMRAYAEINEFEQILLADGMRIAKIFLHITREEQAKRFKARLSDPMKRWKLSYEDFRNRQQWHAYEHAIEDMMERTSTERAPWHLVPANSKPYGRLAVFKILISIFGKDAGLEPRPLDPETARAAALFLDSLEDGSTQHSA